MIHKLDTVTGNSFPFFSAFGLGFQMCQMPQDPKDGKLQIAKAFLGDPILGSIWMFPKIEVYTPKWMVYNGKSY